MKIKCTVCGKSREESYYSKTTILTGEPVCAPCRRDLSIGAKRYHLNGLTIEFKARHCLKCDREFISRNNNRVCNPCKKLQVYESGVT